MNSGTEPRDGTVPAAGGILTRPWSLRRRVTVLLISVGVVLIASMATIVITALEAREAVVRQVEQLTPAQSALHQTMAAYYNQDSGIRSYAETRELDSLEPYEQGRRTLEESLPQLEQAARDNPAIDSEIEALLAAGEAWSTEYAAPVLDRLREGEDPGPAANQIGDERFTYLREASSSAQGRISAELQEAQDDLASATQQLAALLMLVGVVIVVLCGFLWVMLQHWVLRPLDELGRHLQQVSDGYYTHRIELEAPPEIERVARNVDAMRERIVHELDEVGTARRTLQEQSELLERQTEELRRSNLELEQFAYVASHDLQEPLRKVASFCQLLKRRYHGQLDERADSYIDFAVEGAKRMQTLINDLLAFSRVGRTKNFTTVDLNSVLDDALASLGSALEEAEAVVTGDQLPEVQGDRTLLTQVFFNLIGNAVKFRGEEPARVHISVRREGTEWVFCCADNGIGIEPQYAERIFVIFQRLHTRDKYGGTGIGLAMCKKIVEFHGGRIWLDHESDEPGTRICWSLPVDTDKDDDLPEEEASPLTAPPGRGSAGADTRRFRD
ncbi:sensor histidine kinase [Thermobifida cellulosilytica]|uniref:histidine kinase n=1 Tax=Thermobifida cellulosilytica TB100 TaxID=665004 RepID=A0A147KM60_THECS|nr:ATP-binding protein [Thermobifida cellulosilytica]KUP98420.1 histidine kinase [Thermobifida cellulosilytica TB100]